MEEKKTKPNRYLSYAAAVWFLVFILGLPFITLLRMGVQHIPLFEYEDNIFGGYKMIQLNTRISEMLSGGTYMESNEVLLGKDGWLFYKTTTDGTPLYDYMGINRFSEDELKTAYEMLESVSDEAEAAGARCVILTIPNKEQVYNLYMPDTVEKISEVSRLDQMTSYIYKLNGDMSVGNCPYIDMTNTYVHYRDDHQLYFKTDTHYTGIGEYLALREVMKALYGEDDDIYPEPQGIEFIKRPGFKGDLARISATGDRYDEESYEMAYDSVPDDKVRDEILLIIGDSFGDGLQHPAVQYYKEVYYLNIKEYEPGCIEEYEPDVVVFECVERYLPRLIGAEY